MAERPIGYRLTGTGRMAERPIGPLLKALKAWGAEARSIEKTGCPPVEIKAHGLEGGETLLSASKSSQYLSLSSLLLVAPVVRNPARIILDGPLVSGPLVSRPYVDLTIAVMAAFGVDVQEEKDSFLVSRPPISGQPQQSQVVKSWWKTCRRTPFRAMRHLPTSWPVWVVP